MKNLFFIVLKKFLDTICRISCAQYKLSCTVVVYYVEQHTKGQGHDYSGAATVNLHLQHFFCPKCTEISMILIV